MGKKCSRIVFLIRFQASVNTKVEREREEVIPKKGILEDDDIILQIFHEIQRELDKVEFYMRHPAIQYRWALLYVENMNKISKKKKKKYFFLMETRVHLENITIVIDKLWLVLCPSHKRPIENFTALQKKS